MPLLRSRAVGSVREFFRDYCQVTSDVLWEADGHPDEHLLSETAVDVNPAILEKIRTVMSTVGAGDKQLVDLYKNKGAADPGLIASVLELTAADDGMLFADEWALVTNDRAVREKAAEFGINSITPQDLADLIDAGIGSQT